MDGVLGVGFFEIFIVLMVLFVVGGPENVTKWAHESGRWVRKIRQTWKSLMDDLTADLGEDGKELLDTAHVLQQSVRDLHDLQTTDRFPVGSLTAVNKAAIDVNAVIPDELISGQ